MKAIVLAGGVGKRLKPLTERRPKPLLPIAGRPCIDYVIKSLVEAGFREIVVTTCYMSDHLIKRIGSGKKYDASIVYSFEDEPAGTAGAVKMVSDFMDGTFVVASGDVLADVDIKALYRYHKRKGATATMALTEVENPSEFGIVGLDRNSRIVKFKEKPKSDEVFSNLINAGIYILEPKVLDFIPEKKMFDFSKDVFPRILKKKLPLYGKKIKGLWMDIGQPHDLLNANLEIVDRRARAPKLEGVVTKGKIMMGKNVIIEKGVTIQGPCYLGNDVYISKETLLENSCLYNNVHVDAGAVIQSSILLEQSKVGWRSEIRDSAISRNCSIEHNCRIMNSIIGDDMTIKKHSTLVDANVTPPPNNG